MARSLKLLLTETVDNLGIVGDVVSVRTGYARNFLLPRQLATQPSDEAIKALASKRAEAEQQISEQRSKRAEIAKKLEGFELSLVRSCNDMGILYGAVTQQEISKALHEKGYEVRPRDVRLPHAIKRVDNYDVHIKFEADLEAVIKLHVVPDRKLDLDEIRAAEAEADRHAAEAAAQARAKEKEAEKGAAEAAAKDGAKKAGKGEKGEKGAGDKHEKHEKHEKGEKKAEGKKGKDEGGGEEVKDKKGKKGEKGEKQKKE